MARSESETIRTFTGDHSDHPLLMHLNADTSWLISFPRSQEHADDEGRKYYHLLLDPWLSGTNVVGSTWIMSLTHAIAPAFTSIQEVRELILEIERGARGSNCDDDGEPDSVCVTHFAPDHCNEHTLPQLHPTTRIVSAVPGIARTKSFRHFDASVFNTIPDLSLESPEELWQKASLTSSYNSKIPSWLKVGQLPSGGSYPYLHWANIVAWSPSHKTLGKPDSTAELFVYTPHGIRSDRLSATSWAIDPNKGSILCSMHGLSPAWSPQQVNLGVQNGYALSKMLRPRYWVPTHDEELTYTGFIGWFQSRLQKTLEDIIRSSDDITTSIDEELKIAGTTMKELGNGETFCLV